MERSERREEIKLRLEYAKLAISLIGIATIIFAGLQWRDAIRAAEEATYQRMASEWRDHLMTIVERPHLRPYFEGAKALPLDDPNRDEVLALADVRLDAMDAVLTYAASRFSQDEIEAWQSTFESSFTRSPALCTRFKEVRDNYGLVRGPGDAGCP